MSHLTTGNPIDTGLVPSAQDLARIRPASSSNVTSHRGRRRSTVANVLHATETAREKQRLLSYVTNDLVLARKFGEDFNKRPTDALPRQSS